MEAITVSRGASPIPLEDRLLKFVSAEEAKRERLAHARASLDRMNAANARRKKNS